jgi:hypothetical protein
MNPFLKISGFRLRIGGTAKTEMCEHKRFFHTTFFQKTPPTFLDELVASLMNVEI